MDSSFLKDKHKDQTIWIVGKGPSLRYIRKDHFGEGIILTLNESIVAIESLELPNIIYSLQKDGGNGRHGALKNALTPECDYSGQCEDVCGSMVRPKKATLILHELESKYCFSDYPNRVVFDLETLGLQANIHSIVFAVKIAIYLGCNKVNFLCCDSTAIGDSRTYVPGKGISIETLYGNQRPYMLPILEGIEGDWITPLEIDK